MVDFNIRVVVDNQQANAGINRTERALDQTTQRAQRLNQGLAVTRQLLTAVSTASGGVNRLQQSVQASTAQTTQLNASLLATQRTLAQLNRSVGQLTQAQRGIRNVRQETDRLNGSLSITQRLFGTVTAAVGGIFAVRGLIQFGDEIQAINNAIGIATEGADEADAAFARLRDTAISTGTGFRANVRLFQRLSLLSGQLGATQQDLLQFTEGVSASLRVQGVTTTEAAGALLQLAQAVGNTNVQLEEFNSLQDNGVVILQTIADNIDAAGGSVNRLRTLVREGEISGREFFDAFLQGSQDVIDRSAGIAITIGQAFENLRTSLLNFGNTIENSFGLLENFAAGINAVSENLETLLAVVTLLSVRALVPLVTRTLPAVIAGFSTLSTAIQLFTIQGGAAIVATSALRAGLALLGGPVGVIALVGTALVGLVIASDNFTESLGTQNDVLAENIALLNQVSASGTGVVEAQLARNLAEQQRLTTQIEQIRRNERQIREIGAESAEENLRQLRNQRQDVLNQLAFLQGAEAELREILEPAEQLRTPDPTPQLAQAEFLRELRQTADEATTAFRLQEEAIGASVFQIEAARFASEALAQAQEDNVVVTREITAAIEEQALRVAEFAERAELARIYDEATTSIQEQIDALNLQATTLGMSEGAIARARAEQEILNAVTESGVELTEAQVEQLERLLDTLERQTDVNEDLIRQQRLLNEINGGAGTALERYNERLEDLNTLLGEGRISTEQFAEAQREARQEFLRTQNTFEAGLELGLTEVIEQYSNFNEQGRQLLVGVFREAEDALVEFVRTGEFEIGDLFDFLTEQLIRIAAQQLILQPVADALGSIVSGAAGAQQGLGGLFGGGGGGGGGFGGLLGSLFGGGGTTIGGGAGGFFSSFLGGGGGFGGFGGFGFFQDGGLVSGPGGPRSDSIAAMLSNGEFVVNAASTAQFLPLLEAINQFSGSSARPSASVSAPAGITAASGSGVVVNVIDQRSASQDQDDGVEVRESQGDNGELQVDIIVRDTVRRDIRNGELDVAFRDRFGITPSLTRT